MICFLSERQRKPTPFQIHFSDSLLFSTFRAMLLAARCDQDEGHEWWVPYPTDCMDDLRQAVQSCAQDCWVFGGGQAYRVVFEYKDGKFDVAHQVNVDTGTTREVRKFPGTPEGFMRAQMQGEEALTTYISFEEGQDTEGCRSATSGVNSAASRGTTSSATTPARRVRRKKREQVAAGGGDVLLLLSAAPSTRRHFKCGMRPCAGAAPTC